MKTIKKIFKSKLLRFFLVAGLNTAFGAAVYSFLVFLGLGYVWASLLGMIIGIIFNFQTYGGLVFGSRSARLIFRFVGVYAIMYVTNISGISLLKYFVFEASDFFSGMLDWLNNMIGGGVMTFDKIEDTLAGLLLCIPIGILGFILNKNLVFKYAPQKNKPNETIS
ncbi:MAG: GtrA family protein [Bacteroidales bacterium]|nr:GtrA family protein [Bacteroidales bacterium]